MPNVNSIDDCIFYISKTRCAILTSKCCVKCPFKKDEADLIEGREKAADRIHSLPPEKQRKIIDRYGVFD